MSALPRDYDAWRLAGPDEDGQYIVTDFVCPPIPNGDHWTAWDDNLGADTSPIGMGDSEEAAIDDLKEQLADEANERGDYLLEQARDRRMEDDQ